jgi:hypothetical protein
MDHKTNDKGPSSTEDRAMKVGDKVWVLCEVKQALPDGFQVKGCSGGVPFWALAEDCRPVEPEAVEQHLTSESGSVEAKYKIGDWVEIVGPKEPTELRRRWDERMDRYIGMIVEVRALSIPTKNDDALYNLSKCGFLVFREKYLKPASEPCKEKQSEPVNPSHYKQGGIEDLKKARWYLDRLIQEEETK